MRQELAGFAFDQAPEHTQLRIEIQLAGIRQYVIADRIGLSDGQLSKILAGRRPLDSDLAAKIRAAIKQGATA